MQQNTDTLARNHDILYENERIFANRVAARLIPAPQVHIWMILIPVIFVFHFYNLQKVSKGRKAFVHNFLITRRKTLEEVHAAMEEGRKPDIETLADSDDVPQSIRHLYKEWLAVLVAQYSTLMRATGESYEELVQSAYRTRQRYKEALRKLNDAEIRFNSALRPLLPDEDADNADNIIAAMQELSVHMRKEQAKEIFS